MELKSKMQIAFALQSTLLSLVVGGLMFCFTGAALLAQPATDRTTATEAHGRVEASQSLRRLRVAMSELDVVGRPDNNLQAEYERTMRYDLDFSDYFSPLAPQAGFVAQHRRDRETRTIDYRAWQALDCDLLIKAEFEQNGNRAEVRIFAYDVFDEISILPLAYTISFNNPQDKVNELRRSIHSYVDELVKKYDPDGVAGCALSYVAFQGGKKAGPRGKMVREIYIMDYDGKNVRQITRDGDLAIYPAWSPDGRQLVYTSYRKGNPDLYVYNRETGAIRTLAAFPGMNSSASWSPCGNHLALTLSRDGNPEIYRIQANGANPQRMTRLSSVETSPVWSTDGSKIFFISDQMGAPQIMGMSASGGTPWRITRQGHNDDPAVSPRGDLMAFTSNRGGKQFNIWICDINGGNPQCLTSDLSGNSEQPTWARDGRHIAFSNRGRIMVMDIDGGDKRTLIGPDQMGGPCTAPAWSK